MLKMVGLKPRHIVQVIFLFSVLLLGVCAAAQETKDVDSNVSSGGMIGLFDRLVELEKEELKLTQCVLLVLEADQSILRWECHPEIYVELELGEDQMVLIRSYEGQSLTINFEETSENLPNDPEIEDRLLKVVENCEIHGCEASAAATSALSALKDYFSVERRKIHPSNEAAKMGVFGENHGFFVALEGTRLTLLDSALIEVGEAEGKMLLYRFFKRLYSLDLEDI